MTYYSARPNKLPRLGPRRKKRFISRLTFISIAQSAVVAVAAVAIVVTGVVAVVVVAAAAVVAEVDAGTATTRRLPSTSIIRTISLH